MTRHTPDNPATVNTARVWVDQAADAYKQGLADGKAAERDRLRQLADDKDAQYGCGCADGNCDRRKPFADLIGEESQ